MSDVISRQVAISAICSACGKIDCDKMDKCEKLQLPPANNSEIPNSSDTISRQQAIDTLRGYLVGKRCPDDGTLTCRLIENEVINKLPPAQLGTNLAEVGTDCISRQAAIERATKEHDFFRGAVTVSDKARRDELLNVMCWLGELPPAQPKRGKWIEAESQCGIKCSKCGYPVDDFCHSIDYIDLDYAPNYCPNCGRDMREE